MFSKACEYGIKATVFIAQKATDTKWLGINAISEEIDSPVPFTAKVLQMLVKGGVLHSKKGPNGGFFIDKLVLQQITLLHIVRTIDGETKYFGCGLGLKNCNEEKPCPMHEHFKAIRQDLLWTLENTKVIDLAKDLNKKLTFLKN